VIAQEQGGPIVLAKPTSLKRIATMDLEALAADERYLQVRRTEAKSLLDDDTYHVYAEA
jgi:hypothetical protein